jgi:hypothetical protein
MTARKATKARKPAAEDPEPEARLVAELPDGWAVRWDGMCFALGMREAGKDGRARMRETTYHATVGQALASWAERRAAERMAADERNTIEAVLEAVEATRREVEEHFRITQGVQVRPRAG